MGILGTMFPPLWSTPGVPPRLDEEHAHSILGSPIRTSAALLVVLYDPSKRAPASEGDVLGMMSLGCVLENMWLVAHSLGIAFQVQSVFGADPVERAVRRILRVPDPLKIAFALAWGTRRRPTLRCACAGT